MFDYIERPMIYNEINSQFLFAGASGALAEIQWNTART